MSTIWDVLLMSLTIFIVAHFMPGVKLKSFGTAIVVAIVYSLMNFFLFRLLVFLMFPLVGLTLGLFVFVINAFLLWLTDKILDNFEIKDFVTTLIAALLISIIHGILTWVF
mgnify:CR=1 FL=1